MEPVGAARPVAPSQLAAAVDTCRRVAVSIRLAVEVRDGVLHSLLIALLAEGHILIEGYPGVGKTLARALARSLDCQFARVPVHLGPASRRRRRHQRLQPARAAFRVQAGGRSSPMSCSWTTPTARRQRRSPACSKCMQERHVTIDVHTHELARPFVVLATQNPIELEGDLSAPGSSGGSLPLPAGARRERKRRGEHARCAQTGDRVRDQSPW